MDLTPGTFYSFCMLCLPLWDGWYWVNYDQVHILDLTTVAWELVSHNKEKEDFLGNKTHEVLHATILLLIGAMIESQVSFIPIYHSVQD